MTDYAPIQYLLITAFDLALLRLLIYLFIFELFYLFKNVCIVHWKPELGMGLTEKALLVPV